MGKILDTINGISKSELIALDLRKGKGEGSRGGNIIGHTSSGKAIYASSNKHGADHKHLDAADHKSAQEVHYKLAGKHNAAGDKAMSAGNTDKAHDHWHASDYHVEQMEQHEFAHHKKAGTRIPGHIAHWRHAEVSSDPALASHAAKMNKDTKKSVDDNPDLLKGGPFIGKRGGKWADAKHTIPWKPSESGTHPNAPSGFEPISGDPHGAHHKTSGRTKVWLPHDADLAGAEAHHGEAARALEEKHRNRMTPSGYPKDKAARAQLKSHWETHYALRDGNFKMERAPKKPKKARKAMDTDHDLEKSGPFIGKRGGKWADPEHKIPYTAQYAHLDHKQMGGHDDTFASGSPRSLAANIRKKNTTSSGHAINDNTDEHARGNKDKAMKEGHGHFTHRDHQEAAYKIMDHRFDPQDDKTNNHDEQAHLHLQHAIKLRHESGRGRLKGAADQLDHDSRAAAHKEMANYHARGAKQGVNKKARDTHKMFAKYHQGRVDARTAYVKENKIDSHFAKAMDLFKGAGMYDDEMSKNLAEVKKLVDSGKKVDDAVRAAYPDYSDEDVLAAVRAYGKMYTDPKQPDLVRSVDAMHNYSDEILAFYRR